MGYECLDCKKRFLFTAKLVKESEDENILYIEYQVCSNCLSLNFIELYEKSYSEEIESVRFVYPRDVDDYIKKGYKVHQIYAKEVVMKKIKKV